ncbi:beta-L-arabinofuranosidase domain-containing protein [Kiritimatiella glycovorans]|uniref:Non-reducing end beta-L-arabinofuranosidase n=1 Tax=Kiritimatiella glycovorans TaxID=1307763 RepID=A0A0G3EHA5_9BACT|nr:beta-L-arabinofuranosidase domain-containing protein [Kiritimatiella glycovorans]AKJ64210.1 hypothetical protein L21SP4_00948 [Kiritimatiella glycovorans]
MNVRGIIGWVAGALALPAMVSCVHQETMDLPMYTLLKTGEVRPAGWIAEQMRMDLHEGMVGDYSNISENVTQNLFAKQDRKPGVRVKGNRGHMEKAWWAGEHEGYWMDAMTRMSILTQDETFLPRVEAWVERIIDRAEQTGYIGVYSPEARFPDRGYDGELWTQSRVFQALLAWYEYTGDKRVLEAVESTVRKTVDHYREYGTYFGRPDPDGGVTHAVGYMDTLEWLYRLTGESWYAEAAAWLYADYAQSDVFSDLNPEALLDVDRPWEYHAPHVAEGLHMPAVVHCFTGNPHLDRAAANVLAKLDTHTNPGGSLVAGKLENIAATPGGGGEAGEYCAMTESVQTLNRYLMYEGDLHCGDWSEKCTLNAAQGARFHPANRAVIYLARDNRLRADDPEKHGGRELFSGSHSAAACCTLNAMRILPYYVEGMWLRSTKRPELIANLYGPCTVDTEVDGVAVRIEERTGYPFSDRITFVLKPEREVEFSLVLRRPPNCGEIRIEAGEDARVVRSSQDVYVRKRWSAGDTVEVDWDFRVAGRLQHDETQAYYEWGPLVFALPIPERREVLEEITTNSGDPSGYFEYAIRPESDEGWRYRIDKEAEFKRVELPDGDAERPWAHPPIGLKGTLLDAEGVRREVTLKPLGSTILRRTTFPISAELADAEARDEDEDTYQGTGGEGDPMRDF